ncbi:MAG: helix-turn-helix domain-containing protein [Lentisphaeria bacterium]|jgi:hypothetical protein
MLENSDGELLKAVLKSLGLSARAAAEKLGISQARIENWKCDRSPVPASCWAGLWRVRLERDAEQAAQAAKVQERMKDLADLVRRSSARPK